MRDTLLILKKNFETIPFSTHVNTLLSMPDPITFFFTFPKKSPPNKLRNLPIVPTTKKRRTPINTTANNHTNLFFSIIHFFIHHHPFIKLCGLFHFSPLSLHSFNVQRMGSGNGNTNSSIGVFSNSKVPALTTKSCS